MKRLVLLSLAVPLAACATPERHASLDATHQASVCSSSACGLFNLHPMTPAMVHRVSEAETSCVTSRVGPADPHFGKCINNYLEYYYGWNVVRGTKGSLWVLYPVGPGAAGMYPFVSQ
jgi:hypothetical protein